MTGIELVENIRRTLLDVESPRSQGTFWPRDASESWIVLMLNAAQDVVMSELLRTGRVLTLERLVTTTSFAGSPATVPAGFLHPISARTERVGRFETARLFLGASGISFLHVAINRAIVLGNNVYFGDRLGFTGGELYYYRRPLPIAYTAVDLDDMPEVVYHAIADLAIAILSVKDTVNKRTLRRYARSVANVQRAPALVVVNPEGRYER